MKPYENRSGDAGVLAYEIGRNSIRLRFIGGETYEYTAKSVGAANLKKIKRLAQAGEGLTTFINQTPSSEKWLLDLIVRDLINGSAEFRGS